MEVCSPSKSQRPASFENLLIFRRVGRAAYCTLNTSPCFLFRRWKFMKHIVDVHVEDNPGSCNCFFRGLFFCPVPKHPHRPVSFESKMTHTVAVRVRRRTCRCCIPRQASLLLMRPVDVRAHCNLRLHFDQWPVARQRACNFLFLPFFFSSVNWPVTYQLNQETRSDWSEL
jgi:hypothetical protein